MTQRKGLSPILATQAKNNNKSLYIYVETDAIYKYILGNQSRNTILFIQIRNLHFYFF